MARKTTADDGSFQHVERGKEGSRAVTHVIMSHGAAAALLHWQSGLGAIQRLDLTLLIHTKHQRLVGRVEIEAHYVAEFFDKVLVARELESAHPMRLQTVCIPHPCHCHVTDSKLLGQCARAPKRSLHLEQNAFATATRSVERCPSARRSFD